MWDIISRNAGSRNRAVVGRPRSARCTGLGLQVGLPLKAGMDAAAGNQAVLAAFSLKALAVAEPSEKFQQGSTGARAADSPIFAPRTPTRSSAHGHPWNAAIEEAQHEVSIPH